MITATSRVPVWSDAAISRLRDRASCPVCDTPSLTSSLCRRCGADLTTPAARDLWEASVIAADALTRREELRRRIPRAGSAGSPSPSPIVAAQPTEPRTSPPPLRGATSVQTVLAIAGAGLFAVAAIVFTFFNPDLTDPGARALPTVMATGVFLFAARWLAIRGLRSSAETVGALGAVFVALDVYTLSAMSPLHLDPWVFGAVGTLVAALLLLLLALRVRIRSWLVPSLLGIAAVPAMLGLASPHDLPRLAGWLASMAAGAAMVVLARRWGALFETTLIAERRLLTAAQVFFLAAGLSSVTATAAWGDVPLFATSAGALAVVGIVARATAPFAAHRWWSFVSGASMGLAGGALALLLAVGWAEASGGYFLALATGPAVGLIVVARLRTLTDVVGRTWAEAGALSVALAALLPVSAFSALTAADTVYDAVGARENGTLWPASLAAAGLALSALAMGALYPASGPLRSTTRTLAGILAAGSVVAVTALPYPQPWTNVVVGVVAAAALGWTLRPGAARSAPSVRIPLLLAAHVALVAAAAISWSTTGSGAVAASAILASLAVLAATAPARARWAYVAVGYAYFLVAFSAALGLTELGSSAVVSLTTATAAVVAIVTTFLRRIGPHAWWAVLVVTSAPFLLSTLRVIQERSGWTALSTALIFTLALTLVLTRRRGLGVLLRALCAAVLVPSLAVIVICLGAQFLEISASPVTLPAIAVIVGLALSLTTLGIDALPRTSATAAQSSWVGASFEISTLTTGVIAVGLALVREAAGLPTAALVLAILALGSVVAAAFGRRRHLWWAAGAHATGAVWVCWALLGVEVPEPYLLPPSIAAFAIGALLLAHGKRAAALAVTGLAVAVSTTVLAFALEGGLWRLIALLLAAVTVLLTARLIGTNSPLAPLRTPMWVASVVAASAASVHAVRLGVGVEPSAGGAATLWTAIAWAAVSGAIALWSGRMLRAAAAAAPSGGRHDRAIARGVVSAGALLSIGGAWPSIHRDWPTIWSMWTLMMLVLVATVAVGVSPRQRARDLPPVWFLFGLAFATAVVAWSPRDLRVEWFSLPLGAALLIIGAAHLSAREMHVVAERWRIQSWPHAFSGSWALLLPGLIVSFSASIAATFTDPLTWRAILVIVMALVAILVGARQRLAAPFVTGIVVLPIENVSAFSVQIGRGIESMPWWITLAAVGAVLLIIAVSYERREDAAVTQRLRDLR